ncbi:hypothetical protein [Methylobacterium durans]|uniref:Uncharacterized protein n=1 Tax=Methylobacterium durans TaxID=2202825 RepID=A0A2U8WBP8_9HYPH|nr:hypothetical protein [Methylobacterium durans]AWN43021.1 hypothetical protein DK389_24165 [Methylobacterium durans]
MPSIVGIVTIAQESRFQLTDAQGVSHLFVLSPHALAEGDDLEPLQREQARVRVHFEAARNILGYRAERIERT